ncbi:hypothetical protein BHE74_00008747 [Ensete ventricosum]|nr:hypothetical protein BHE74_00008747 [Ensete ventricosum]
MASKALDKGTYHAKGDGLHNDRKSCAKLTEVRGIANSKNLVLMQGLVCGGWSVCDHPKATKTRRHGALKLYLRHENDTSHCVAKIALVGDRGPGSRQWCTNFSKVCGLRELLGDELSQSDSSTGCDPIMGGRRSLAKEASTTRGGKGLTMCWQRPHIERLYDKELLGAPLQLNAMAMDSSVMGLVAPWYRRGGTSVKSSIPCSHGGRALVVKGAEEVENAEADSKYQDKAEGQRPRNFIRPVSMSFSSR